MPKFNHKTIVITGACGGIGRALALRFGEGGGRIALIDINAEQLASFTEHLQSRNIQVRGYLCDISDSEQVQRSFLRIKDDFGKIDVLINNAGITHNSRFEDTDPSVFQKLMDVNYFGAVHCTRAALPDLISSCGQIITMSSMSGFAPFMVS